MSRRWMVIGVGLMAMAAWTLPAAMAAQAPQDAPAAPATQPRAAMSPAQLTAALQQLSTNNFTAQQQAVEQIKRGMTANMRRLVVVQDALVQLQQGLADELTALTNSNHAASQAQVAALMEFQDALSRWAIDVMPLPRARRQSMIRWGLSSDVVPIMAHAYSVHAPQRVKAAQALAAIQDPNANWVLQRMLDDPDPTVVLAAMNALWNRPPTPDVRDALWQMTVDDVVNMYHQQRQKRVTFHGQQVNVSIDISPRRDSQLAMCAARELAHYHAPETGQRLESFLSDYIVSPDATNRNSSQTYIAYQLAIPESMVGRAFEELINTYHPKAIVPLLMSLLTVPSRNGYLQTSDWTNGGKHYFSGGAVEVIAEVAKITHQDPAAYGLHQGPEQGNRWVVQGTPKDVTAAEKKLEAWWQQHQSTYSAATAPAK